MTTVRPEYSFEFFPPKNDKMEAMLWETVDQLADYRPRFVSVTYGAGGTTRARTHDIVARLQRDRGLTAAAHLTCVEATREEIDEVARAYWNDGIRHIVALRGDPPGGADQAYEPHPGGYAYADDLVTGLRAIADFEISVGAYPEMHPQAPDADFDIAHLKRKLDNGADRAITQFFFEPEMFLRFRDLCAKAGIEAPVVPGILPIANFTTACRFAGACGASIPDWLHARFNAVPEDDEQGRLEVSRDVAIDLVRALTAEGIDEFHFYTLNRAALTRAILDDLGVEPQAKAA